jgi:tRNA threonylcarbamoyladenosine biosynthesis protein TsaB
MQQVVWRHETMVTGHAERLMPMIGEVMAEAGRSLDGLDAIVVTEGPGTFTGIRIGVAAARGLALAAGLPIRAATSLHVMATQAIALLGSAAADQQIAVAMDARNSQIYVQFFDGRTGDSMTPAALTTPAQAAADCTGKTLIGVGSAAKLLAAEVEKAGIEVDVRLPDLQPDARILAELAPKLQERKPLVPLYLRLPDAKPQIGKSLPRA